jgi:hypothetical protein
MVANSADVPAQNVVVIVFADANGDGTLDADETASWARLSPCWMPTVSLSPV